MTLRELVYELDAGICRGCGKVLPPGGDVWAWQVHHCLKQQWLIQRGALLELEQEAQLCILLCKRCHEGHEQRHRVIPASRLPVRVHEAVRRLGVWAEDRFATYHREHS